MSAQDQPPSYDDHSKYRTEPPQPTFQQPALIPVPQPNPNFQPHVTVVTQQPTGVVVGTVGLLGPIPMSMTCSNCHAYITTSTFHEISMRTHCCAVFLCLTGLWPCAVLPYICGGCCKRTVHKCPNCNAFIGSN